jgi:hypothetical protein
VIVTDIDFLQKINSLALQCTKAVYFVIIFRK